MAPTRRLLALFLPGQRREPSDGGFSLIEVVVALGLLLTVMATTAGFFTTSLKQSNGQTQAQEAAVLADQMLDYTRSVPAGSLLSGRTQAAVDAAIASPPAGVNLADDITGSGNYDTSASTSQAVPITLTSTVGGTKYTLTTFIDQCYLTAQSSAACKSAVTSYGWLYRITVGVTYSLSGGRSCTNNNTCYYVASTLRDIGTDPCFNVNASFAGCSTSQPTITNINPSTVNTGSTTTVTLTGTNFDSGATVSLDTGGTVSNVNVGSSTSLTFTLTTDNTSSAAGTRTVKVTNPNGKFAYGTMTIAASQINVTGITPSSVTTGSTTSMTIAGSGFQNGASVSISSVAGTIVGTPTISSNSITLNFTAGTSASSVGTWPVTVTNPDGSSDSANLSIQQGAISVTSVSPATMTQGSTRNFTITGSGFNSGASVTLDGSNVNGTWVSSTSMSVALTSDPSTGSHTFTVTNPDGGSASGTFSVTSSGGGGGGTAQITGMSPQWFSHRSWTQVTITGTGFVTSGTKTAQVTVNGSTYGVWGTTIVSSTKVTFYYYSSSQYWGTLPVQVTSKDGSVSSSYDWGVYIY